MCNQIQNRKNKLWIFFKFCSNKKVAKWKQKIKNRIMNKRYTGDWEMNVENWAVVVDFDFGMN